MNDFVLNQCVENAHTVMLFMTFFGIAVGLALSIGIVWIFWFLRDYLRCDKKKGRDGREN